MLIDLSFLFPKQSRWASVLTLKCNPKYLWHVFHHEVESRFPPLESGLYNCLNNKKKQNPKCCHFDFWVQTLRHWQLPHVSWDACSLNPNTMLRGSPGHMERPHVGIPANRPRWGPSQPPGHLLDMWTGKPLRRLQPKPPSWLQPHESWVRTAQLSLLSPASPQNDRENNKMIIAVLMELGLRELDSNECLEQQVTHLWTMLKDCLEEVATGGSWAKDSKNLKCMHIPGDGELWSAYMHTHRHRFLSFQIQKSAERRMLPLATLWTTKPKEGKGLVSMFTPQESGRHQPRSSHQLTFTAWGCLSLDWL